MRFKSILLLLGIVGMLPFPGRGSVARAETLPPARFGHSAVFDPVRDRMVIFGGNDGFDLLLGDCWALSLGSSPSWTSLQTSGPAPQPHAYHCAVHDPFRDRMIVIAGSSNHGLTSEVWALQFSDTPAWTQLVPTGTAPSARQMASAVFDSKHNRILLIGGLDDLGPRHDVWALSLGAVPAWTPIAMTGPEPSDRYSQSAIYDLPHDRVVMFGGGDLFNYFGDTWSLKVTGASGQWTELSPSGAAPPARRAALRMRSPILSRSFCGSS